MSNCNHVWGSTLFHGEDEESAVCRYCRKCFRSKFEIDLEEENERLKARLDFAGSIVKDVYEEYKHEDWVIVGMMENFIDEYMKEQGE